MAAPGDATDQECGSHRFDVRRRVPIRESGKGRDNIGKGYADWSSEFIDTILNFVERDRRMARRFRTWREARSRHRTSGVSARMAFHGTFPTRPDVVNGQWVIKGTRVTLRASLAEWSDGRRHPPQLPAVTHDDIRAGRCLRRE
jgi:hypothetical protein